MKNLKTVFGLLFLSTIVLVSCKKYENGGTISRADKNIKKAWKLESYYLDGTDQTSNLLISNYVETYNEDGSYNRTFIDASGDPKNENGLWSFDADKSLLNISGIGSFELTGQTSTVSASDYTILKLKKNELWYSFENGGNTHEFHLVPN